MTTKDLVKTGRSTGPKTRKGKLISSMNSLKDGSSSPLIVSKVARTIQKSYLPWLEEQMPWLKDDYGPKKELLVLKRARLVLLHKWLAEYGEIDEHGSLYSQAEKANELENQLSKLLDSLGGSPLTRAALGLDVAKGRYFGDLASQLQEARNGQ